MDLPAHYVPLVGLLAIPAAVVFAASRGEPAIALAIVNVCIIVASLHRAMSGETGSSTHAAASS
ncbi:hypothetical protein ACFQAS_10690 [Halopenitus salinus]|uniref:DUF8131 domain-containing protein n=1 Tax=Halopenitus salinus TaxID=1198295 RepID=A0ABD5UX96_9EURY